MESGMLLRFNKTVLSISFGTFFNEVCKSYVPVRQTTIVMGTQSYLHLCVKEKNKLENWKNIKVLQNVVKKTKLQYLVVNIEPLWMVVHFVGLYCYSCHETKRLEIIQ